MRRRVRFVIYFLLCFTLQGQEDDSSRAFDAYRNSRWGEAAILFDRVWQADPGNEEALLYLALSQQRNEAYDAAESSFRSGIDYNGIMADKISLCYANFLFSMQRFSEAETVYSRLVDSGSDQGSAALLNRANLKMNTESYSAAVEDYEAYLVAAPGNPQEASIRELVDLLKEKARQAEEIAAAEAEKLLEEQQAAEDAARQAEEQRLADEQKKEEERIETERLAEEKRLADEKKRQEEEKRQQELLNDILNSLSSAGDETQVFSAGSEEIIIEEEESGIDE